MDVRVEGERLAPSVEHSEDAEQSAKLRFAYIEDGLSRRPQEDGVKDDGSVKGQRVKTFGDGEDGVEVGSIEDLAPPSVEPALSGLGAAARTMPVAAGVPEDVLEAAVITLIAMTAESISGNRSSVPGTPAVPSDGPTW